MTDVILRGSKNIMKAIKEGAAEVSKANGINTMSIPTPTPQGGAAYSLQRMQNPSTDMTPIKEMFANTMPQAPEKVDVYSQRKFDFEKSMSSRLIESLETLSTSKEYFNALQSMITLYASGNLTEGVMKKITEDDLSEIKGILNEFKSVLDSF